MAQDSTPDPEPVHIYVKDGRPFSRYEQGREEFAHHQYLGAFPPLEALRRVKALAELAMLDVDRAAKNLDGRSNLSGL
jgi:hypothetical protein